MVDCKSEKYAIEKAKELDIPIIVRVKHALDILFDGEEVSLDPEKALVFKTEENKT